MPTQNSILKIIRFKSTRLLLSSLSRAHSNNRLCHIPTSNQSFRLFTVKWCVQIRHYFAIWVTFFWLGREIHWTFNVSESSWATFLQALAKPSKQSGDFFLRNIWDSRQIIIIRYFDKSVEIIDQAKFLPSLKFPDRSKLEPRSQRRCPTRGWSSSKSRPVRFF